MKKIIFLLLLIFSTSIFAEWTIQGGNDDTTLYIDFQSMRKEGQIIDLWNMIDNKTTQVNGDYKYLSEKNHFEYDCEKETLRILDGSFYADHMGKGDTVFEQLNLKEKPEKITTGTMTEVLWKIACDKKGEAVKTAYSKTYLSSAASKLILTMLIAVAMERDLLIEHTQSALANAKGKHLGRPSKTKTIQRSEIKQKLNAAKSVGLFQDAMVYLVQISSIF